MDRLSALIARNEIEDVLLRYARAVDRRDWDALRDVFHADAIDVHGDFRGGPEGFIDWVRNRHADIPFSMHFLGNCLIEFIDEDTAAVETYFIAMQRRESAATAGAPASRTDHEVFGRYCDRFERRDGEWRVAHRQVAYDSTRAQPSTDHLRRLVGVIGKRDKTDAVYGLREPRGPADGSQ